MRVIGLDLSTKVGLALVEGPGKAVVHTRAIEYKKLTGMPRVNALVGEIMQAVEQLKPDFAVVEDYAVSQFGGAAICSIEIGTVLRFILWQNDFPFVCVSPTALKKFVTGKGQSKKENMILEVYKRYGFEAPTNDIADAVGLGMFGLCAAGVDFGKLSNDTAATLLAKEKAFALWLRSAYPERHTAVVG